VGKPHSSMDESLNALDISLVTIFSSVLAR